MANPRSIRLLTHEFFPSRGGIATYAESTARAAAARGHAVEVWAPDKPGLAEAAFPFDIHPLALRGSQDWPCRLKLAKAIRSRKDWDRHTVYLPEPGPIRTWMYARQLKLPKPDKLVLTLHGSELFLLSKAPWRRRRFQRLLTEADRIGVVSDYVRRELLHRFPATDPDRCRRVPGAPPEPLFELQPEFPTDTPFTFLFVGRMHPRKGPHRILEALRYFPEEDQDECRLLTIGPTTRQRYLKRLTRYTRRHALNWEHWGIVSEKELKSCYQRSHALILPSSQHRHSVEGLGLVLLEAAAVGLPVIANQSGGTPEALLPGKSGFLVRAEDANGLAQAMLALKQNPRLARQMGSVGKAWVRDAFSWERNVSALFEGD
ncbi:MAG: glycosyltransferase family 4 protein [Opitutales bacterium]|nr:glycosyltransferase family 4 protein [Opitutales bacterium]